MADRLRPADRQVDAVRRRDLTAEQRGGCGDGDPGGESGPDRDLVRRPGQLDAARSQAGDPVGQL
jgi:hypothetical protein